MIITKEQYLIRIFNPERAFLLEKDGDDLYLCADMEIVDEQVDKIPIRSEKMCFLMRKEEDFLYEAVECRARYCGGIRIDDNENKDDQIIYNEFVNIENEAEFHVLKNSTVKEIFNYLHKGFNYVIIE